MLAIPCAKRVTIVPGCRYLRLDWAVGVIEALDVRYIVPGHGNVCGTAEVKHFRQQMEGKRRVSRTLLLLSRPAICVPS